MFFGRRKKNAPLMPAPASEERHVAVLNVANLQRQQYVLGHVDFDVLWPALWEEYKSRPLAPVEGFAREIAQEVADLTVIREQHRHNAALIRYAHAPTQKES